HLGGRLYLDVVLVDLGRCLNLLGRGHQGLDVRLGLCSGEPCERSNDQTRHCCFHRPQPPVDGAERCAQHTAVTYKPTGFTSRRPVSLGSCRSRRTIACHPSVPSSMPPEAANFLSVHWICQRSCSRRSTDSTSTRTSSSRARTKGLRARS